MDNILEIGAPITFTTSTGTHTGVVTGRNWSAEHLLSYIVRQNGMDLPIDPTSFKCHLCV